MTVVKPLGLPVGSVRALLLLGFGARAVFDLRAGLGVAPWLSAALILSAAAYFAARAASPPSGGGEGPRLTPPLGLPKGSVRTLFLVFVGYGLWLWLKEHDVQWEKAPLVWVLLGFGVGLFTRLLLGWTRRPADPGAHLADHLIALVALICVGGLVALAALDPRPDVQGWVDPLLAAVAVHYFATR